MDAWLASPQSKFYGFVALCLLLLLMAGLARLLARKPEAYPYEKQPALFTPAERAFLLILLQALPTAYQLFGKVRLADLIKPTDNLNESDRWRAFNKISAKHVDFVICRRDDLRVVGAIELDDSSHQRPDRQARDAFVDAALAAAGLPILHVKVARHYPVPKLKQALAEKLGIDE
jgi:hypothetical protein